MKLIFWLCLLLGATLSHAQAPAPASKPLSEQTFKERFGAGYFFFFDGPNLEDGRDLVTNRTGLTGNPINSYYIFQFKYKLTEKYFLDFQPGVQHWYTRVPRARFDRIRMGISGKLVTGASTALPTPTFPTLATRPKSERWCSHQVFLLDSPTARRNRAGVCICS